MDQSTVLRFQLTSSPAACKLDNLINNYVLEKWLIETFIKWLINRECFDDDEVVKCIESENDKFLFGSRAMIDWSGRSSHVLSVSEQNWSMFGSER